jgi:hypothetical protein
MSKFLDRWELHSAHLLAVLILLTFSAAAAGAQNNLACWNGSQVGNLVTWSPQYWAPGQTVPVTLTDPLGLFVGGYSPSQSYYFVITQASYNAGSYTAEDPNVTVANLQYVNPTTISFQATVASGAPIGRDAFSLWCPLISEIEVAPSIFITPCAVAATPTITSLQSTPSVWVAGQSTTVTISGTNFMPNGNANGCAPTELSISVPTGSVPWSSMVVASPTQITVTVSPAASDPAESATVTAANVNLNGSPAFLVSNAATTPIAPLSGVVTSTGDIMDGVVGLNLTAPSGTSGELTLALAGSKHQYSQTFSPSQPGTESLDLSLSSIAADTYTSIDGTWDTNIQSVDIPPYTFPAPWVYFGYVRYTQYNVPYESSCTGGQGNAWIVTTSCTFTKVSLNSTFVSQAWINGTGVSNSYGTLKNAAAVNLGDQKGPCVGKYPSGAIGHGTTGGNTFEEVSSVTGSCNKALVNNQSAAVPASGNPAKAVPLSGVVALSCGNKLNLDPGNNTSEYTRTAADLCPACSNSSTFTNGTVGHVDSYSSSPSCTVGPGMLPDLGDFYSTKTN